MPEDTPQLPPPLSCGVLVHGADAAWRRAQRSALIALAASAESTAVALALQLTVFLSSREAEAAKWFADPRLSLVVARDDDAAFRIALSSVAVTLPVLWVSAPDAESAASVDAIARQAIALLTNATRRP